MDHSDLLKDVKITSNATVEGILLDVSLIKMGHTSRYIDAKGTDEYGKMHLIGLLQAFQKEWHALKKHASQ